ncbi:MAG: 16S rRNA (guanine(527)-N(7))-methyltransferase RsmG [Tildeniella nuda ZEHNDER 1965/U140]|nr:16S rRNA (guanine(527)-N(7))-methyltransferase RsmG [Tildeniella nuda ZEHNDER 1965/U140]
MLGSGSAIAGASTSTDVAAASATKQAPLTRVPQTSPLPTMAGLWQLTLGWQPNEQQQAQFQQLYTLILAGNHQFNLTRITEPMEFWEKHLWDSLVGVKAFLPATERQRSATKQEWAGTEEMGTAQVVSASTPFKAIDIGTGAGFPGIPVAIAQPTWAVTLLDSTRKKMTFLDQVLGSMGLANATTLAERVEQVGRQQHQRQTYDLALVRAVATATVCAEYALPLLKNGGSAVLYRGQWTAAEMTALEAAVAQLGGAIDAIESFTTPLTHSIRHCIYLKKMAPTPNGFPRAIGIPTQNPL